MNIEERLARIEALLAELLERLRVIEEVTVGSSVQARLAVDMVIAFSKPVQEAVRLAKVVASALERLGGSDDDLAKAIIEVLAANGPLSLRGLEREVRRIRGHASRSRIQAKVGELERIGIVRVERRGRRMVISLATEE